MQDARMPGCHRMPTIDMDMIWIDMVSGCSAKTADAPKSTFATPLVPGIESDVESLSESSDEYNTRGASCPS